MSEPHSEPTSTHRTRTFSWEDPAALFERSKGLAGIDYLRAIVAGELPPPPIAQLMNMSITEASEGRVVFTSQPAEYHYNPIGSVHGGFAATLLDSAMGCTVSSVLPAGVGYTTLELKVNYVRAMTHKTGIVECAGSIIHLGRQIVTAEAHITDAAGKLYAHATTTCLILRG